ncbi:MAG: low molecular weight phosphotyrosine protein phosphatase [Alcanivoracaceae bacterium]|nr:low molecular weight phosphotyrosine protein phosphatase [Alcanivoracaceae bacterium]
MFASILTVCDGNICRSPTAEFILQSALPDKRIESAGLVGLTRHDMAPKARAIAEQRGVSCPIHSAKKIEEKICREFDLIIVMEKRQKDELIRRFPFVGGKTYLIRHWLDGADVPDPWQRDDEVYQHAFKLIDEGAQSWVAKLR